MCLKSDLSKVQDISMPGASLWLVPPYNSNIDDILSTLIAEIIPKRFPALKAPPKFLPHLTLTSDIAQEAIGGDPQAWLDGLPISVDYPPVVSLQALDIGQSFFRKLTLSTKKSLLQGLAIQVRAAAVENGDVEAAEHWLDEKYAPHVSLLYAEIEINEIQRREVLDDLVEAGIRLETEGLLGGREREGLNGWDGGRIVLVPTWKELKDWTVIAEKAL